MPQPPPAPPAPFAPAARAPSPLPAHQCVPHWPQSVRAASLVRRGLWPAQARTCERRTRAAEPPSLLHAPP
eukprot:7384811-Prymnesium_polylepis.1